MCVLKNARAQLKLLSFSLFKPSIFIEIESKKKFDHFKRNSTRCRIVCLLIMFTRVHMFRKWTKKKWKEKPNLYYDRKRMMYNYIIWMSIVFNDLYFFCTKRKIACIFPTFFSVCFIFILLLLLLCFFPYIFVVQTNIHITNNIET